jgi:hypothetical protein
MSRACTAIWIPFVFLSASAQGCFMSHVTGLPFVRVNLTARDWRQRLPEETACLCCTSLEPGARDARARDIRAALKGRWYVPILRDDVGDSVIASGPWSPDVSAPIEYVHHLGSTAMSCLFLLSSSVPIVSQASRPILALAGPMSEQDAKELLKKWRSCNRGTGYSVI